MKKWKVLAGPLPKGLRFDPTLGTLSGTPTKAGKYRVTFQVTDGLKVVAKDAPDRSRGLAFLI